MTTMHVESLRYISILTLNFVPQWDTMVDSASAQHPLSILPKPGAAPGDGRVMGGRVDWVMCAISTLEASQCFLPNHEDSE